MDTTGDDGADPGIERVRRELALLGRDESSAPKVPAAVTARIGAALRAADPPAHSVPRPRLRRSQLIGLVLGVTALGAGAVLGASTLLREPASRFPTGPTAEKITRSTAPFPLTSDDIVALTTANPDYGPFTDPQQRASCLQRLGYPPATPVLGARSPAGQGVVLVLPGESPETLLALLVAPDCAAVSADTVVRRP